MAEKNVKKTLTSCFGLGLLPVAPGTWGSMPAVLVYLAVYHFRPSYMPAVLAAMVVISSVVCVAYSGAWIQQAGKKDPSQVVADECAGQGLTLFIITCLGTAGVKPLTTAIIAFVFFRAMDIIKPWPCRRLEYLPQGWGILADDLMAGVYAAGAFFVAVWTGAAGYLDRFFTSSGPLTVELAGLLGFVQGVAEFLPVSSSGHLVILEGLFKGISPESREMLLFDIATHLGTMASIVAVYYYAIIKLGQNVRNGLCAGAGLRETYRKNVGVRLIVLTLAATVATGVIYKIFKHPLESARKPVIVAVCWLVTAGLLIAADMQRKRRISLRRFGITAAVIVGIAQGAAILPGLSRSGATICTAILLGLYRRWAVELAFMIAVPAILGATVLKFAEEIGKIDPSALPVNALITGVAVSFFTGVSALKILIAASTRRRLRYFAVYCIILAVFVLVYLL